jgi:hypothetical protein
MGRLGALAGLVLVLAGLAACDKKDEKAGDKAAGEGKQGAVTEKAAPPGLLRLEAGDDVIAFAGTGPVTAAVTEIQKLAGQVLPAVPPLPQMVGPAVQGEWRLKDPNAIAADKPMRFAGFDPKKFKGDPFAYIYGVTGKDAFVAALPDNKQAGTDGNAWSYVKFEGSNRPVYVNFLGDGHVVLTRNKDVFAQNKEFLQKLADAQVEQAGAGVVVMRNVSRIFAEEMNKGFAEMKQVAGQAAQQTPGGANQVAVVNAMADWMATAARDLDTIEGRVVLVADGLKLQFSLRPKAGAALEKTFRSLEGRGDASILARLPASAPFFMLGSADPAKMDEMARPLLDAFVTGPMFGGDQVKAKAVGDTMSQYLSAMTGDFAMASFATGGQGLELAALVGVKDADKLRQAARAWADIYQDPAAAAYQKAAGVDVTIQKDAYQVAGVPVDIVQSKLTQLPAEAAPMAGMLSGFLTQHVAYGKDVGVIAYGTDAKKTIEGLLTGSIKGGLDQDKGVKRALEHKAKNTWMMLYFSPVDLAREVKLNGMNPLAPMLAGVEAETGIAFSLGSADGAAEVVLDVPVETIQKGYQAFEKSKGSF